MKRYLIKIKNHNVSIKDIANHLLYLPSEEIVTFFQNKNVTIDSSVIRLAFKQVLDERGAIAAIKRNMSPGFIKTINDYDMFLGYQYMKLIEKADLGVSDKIIRFTIWTKIFEIYEEFGIEDYEVIELLKLVDKYKNGNIKETAIDIYSAVKKVSSDENGFIDGVELIQAHKALLSGSSLSEINELSEILGVTRIKTLTKEEFLEHLVEKLTQKGIYNPKLFSILRQVSYSKLEMFAIDNGLAIVKNEDKMLAVERVIDHAASVNDNVVKKADIQVTDPMQLLSINVNVDKYSVNPSEDPIVEVPKLNANLNIASLIATTEGEPTVEDLAANQVIETADDKNKIIDLIAKFEDFNPGDDVSGHPLANAVASDESISDVPEFNNFSNSNSNIENKVFKPTVNSTKEFSSFVNENEESIKYQEMNLDYDYSSINASPDAVQSTATSQMFEFDVDKLEDDYSPSSSLMVEDDFNLDDF